MYFATTKRNFLVLSVELAPWFLSIMNTLYVFTELVYGGQKHIYLVRMIHLSTLNEADCVRLLLPHPVEYIRLLTTS